MQEVLNPDRITLRVPPEVRERWQELADEECRSMANWIRWMIEKGLKQEGKLN